MENEDTLMPHCGVHYLTWGLHFCSTVCLFFILIRSQPPPPSHESVYGGDIQSIVADH